MNTAAADARISPAHPFAQHRARVANLGSHRPWTPDDGPLPALYVSHGAPPLFESAEWMQRLHTWARSMPKPQAILVVSAHWESSSLGITSTSPQELVYDFGGFDPMYYAMRYDTPPSTELAALLRGVLPDTTQPHEHANRGLDHGAWVPLKVMYPEADVPVLQLSLPTWAPDKLIALGERLRHLREQGVLVVGSGFMTHGLPYLDWSRPERIPGWSAEFDDWAWAALQRGDVAELQHYQTRAPSLRFAHPTVEHFTPLFVTLGAATDPGAPVVGAIDGYMWGLSRRSFQVG